MTHVDIYIMPLSGTARIAGVEVVQFYHTSRNQSSPKPPPCICCLFFATLLTLASSISAVPIFSSSSSSSSSHVLHEKRDEGPQSLWTRHSRAQGHERLPIRIGLKQRNLEHADRFIQDVSDPTSPNFGKHWTADKVANIFAPAKETSDRVVEWLRSAGIDAKRLKHSAGTHL